MRKPAAQKAAVNFSACSQIEAHAECVAFYHSVDFGEGRSEPCKIVIVADGSPIVRAVVFDVGRIGEHEIHGVVVQHRQGLGAVAVDDRVAEGSHGGVPLLID
jgi:hypothetical protein